MSADVRADMLEGHRRRFDVQVATIAARLRDIADAIERAADGKHSPLRIMQDVEHELRWGYANLPIGTALSWACDIATLQIETSE